MFASFLQRELRVDKIYASTEKTSQTTGHSTLGVCLVCYQEFCLEQGETPGVQNRTHEIPLSKHKSFLLLSFCDTIHVGCYLSSFSIYSMNIDSDLLGVIGTCTVNIHNCFSLLNI